MDVLKSPLCKKTAVDELNSSLGKNCAVQCAQYIILLYTVKGVVDVILLGKSCSE